METFHRLAGEFSVADIYTADTGGLMYSTNYSNIRAGGDRLMGKYKITYKAGKNEHVLEVEAESKEQAGKLAREKLGPAIRIIDVIHLPEQHELELF